MSEPAAVRPPLLVLTGCTASGKESTAAICARAIQAEILCADSVKPYRGLTVVSAAPRIAPSDGGHDVRHHLVGVLDPAEPLDAARWCKMARASLDDIASRGAQALVVGGTALYLRSLLFGIFDGPPANAALRAALGAEEDLAPGSLHARLAGIDPVSAARLHRNDRKRIIRALEVASLTGEPISTAQKQWDGPPAIPYVAVGLRRTREDLRGRINRRIDAMLAAGLLDEVRALAPVGRLGRTAGDAIGVKELLPALRTELETGVVDRAAIDEAVEQIRRNTWTFARRQDTWWRRFPGVAWLDVAADEPPAETAHRVLALFQAS